MKSSDKDDFNPQEAIKDVADNLEQPDKFAKIFSNACKKSKEMDKSLRNVIREMLENDNDMRGILKGMIRKVEKEDWRYFVKKVGFVGWTLIIFILSSITNGIIGKFFN